MSDQDFLPSKYSELRSIYEYYIDSYNELYQLKTIKEEELRQIYNLIKIELIDSKIYPSKKIIKDIFYIIPYNNRYTKSYLSLTKLICDDYHVEEVKDIPTISNYMFYKEYGIILDKSEDFEKIKFMNIDIHSENTIYKAIMHNDLERFITFTEIEGFNKDKKLRSDLYPYFIKGYSLLELCCYHGSVDCFKLLRSKFNSEITQKCLQFSFLGGNPEIMSECLKHQTPDEFCMKYAIISHNIDFVTFLLNEYNIQIDLECCGEYNNIESFLVSFDQTYDLNKFFVYSTIFNISSLCEYFLLNGANINAKNIDGKTALHIATSKINNNKEIVELLLSHGANINEKDNYGATALHKAGYNNNKEIVELLLSNGANIDEKNSFGRTTLHNAACYNCQEIAKLLLSHGANINARDNDGRTPLHYATDSNRKEFVKLLLSQGANINEKDLNERTALHIAAANCSKEIVELLLSYDAKIDEKDKNGRTALHIATKNCSKDIIELLLSYDANINEKDKSMENKCGNTGLEMAK
ncbi:ankyrin repeat protein, putative [Trichomonas vaginalis G3]|uniref:Ankyrin repeat protein, putative n=1 Tax=Trichomonas vaginalis (strain ATCC PRA-98 / G3) TaxID=412133 RepID=A2FME9_TRIV3|nr:ankyrin repeat and SOCS box-containing protein 4 family [Trichomonas vaginalis G3]EAX93924.1 ankyrin repeat protein, putative [Trichomonas vaginalis G3]KAI5523183.1 ankyrin repeat and SOCS box-containing protein 4 family [Trichomonas vaginalis G3]|eukprot:XP_001306854.1 ankyrin repeat protein [Trichomonas vaginalis G3]